MRNSTGLLLLAALAGLLYAMTRPKARSAIGAAGASVIEKLASSLDPVRRAIEREEGRVNYAYLDTAGKWTIGIGHLIQPHEQYLLAYTREAPAPDDLVDKLFERDIATARAAVDTLNVPLSSNQRAALISLVFNIGAGAFAGSTLRKKILAGDYAGAAAQFPAWNKETRAGVKVASAGLTARRAREQQLFMTA